MQLDYHGTIGIEVRAETGKNRLVGYAAVFNSLSKPLGGFREVVAPGAFKRSLKERPDVFALVDHDPRKRLARVQNNSLRISEDARGLNVEIDLPDTQTGKDLYAEVRDGLIDTMSFGFSAKRAGSDRWEKTGDQTLRTLVDVDLFEVSATAFAAYEATKLQVATRSFQEWVEQQNVDSNAAARIAANARASRMRMRLRLAAA